MDLEELLPRAVKLVSRALEKVWETYRELEELCVELNVPEGDRRVLYVEPMRFIDYVSYILRTCTASRVYLIVYVLTVLLLAACGLAMYHLHLYGIATTLLASAATLAALYAREGIEMERHGKNMQERVITIARMLYLEDLPPEPAQEPGQ